ncbi:MAG TPA: hypothetical protein VIJ05_03135, partial [Actinomycetes bacterium]
HYRQALTWWLASIPFWITGAAVAAEPRLWWWGAATVIDVTGVWLAHPWPHRRTSTRGVALRHGRGPWRLVGG